ncbi:MAG: site-2 protease family protein [Oscillospiraceae bacterium]|nr:site-2 protease family protein [Oscillospiraceae bacterium]
MFSFTSWLQQLRFDRLLGYLVGAAAALLCIAVHETCHGLAALALGDDTAKREGRLSLNPLRHIDPVGLLMMVFFHFGWARPVRVNMYRFKNPKAGMAITALAGPVSNIVLCLIGLMILYPVSYVSGSSKVMQYVLMFLSELVLISAGLAIFNFFPIPPLDGSKVLFSLLPDRAYAKLMQYERYGMILLVILLLSNMLDRPLSFLLYGLLDVLSFLLKPYYQLISSIL